MQTTNQAIPVKNRPDLFNVIRTTAFLMVLLCHTVLTYRAYDFPGNFPFFMNTSAWGAMVWFFMLSGYLLGKGFYNGKYDTPHGGFIFIVSRFFKIAPYYYFAVLMQFLCNPEWLASVGVKTVFRILTFTWTNNTPNIATWFISTLFQLYVFAPIVYFLILKKLNKRGTIVAFVLTVAAGAIMRWYLPKHGFTWLTLYQASWSNSDAFFGGMLLCGIMQDSVDGKWKKLLRYLSIVATEGFILADSYFIAHMMHIKVREFRFPTVYLLLLSLILFAFDTNDKAKSAPLTFANFRRNPLRIFDFFAKISFGMYLVHSYLITVFPRLFNAMNLRSWRLYTPVSLLLGYSTIVLIACIAHSYFDSVVENLRKKYLGLVPSCIEKLKTEKSKHILFLVLFAMVSVYPVMHVSKTKRSEREYRNLAQKPSLFKKRKINTAYGKQFNEWLNDHFTSRDRIILSFAHKLQKIQSYYSGKWLGREIYVAKDHWIFAKGEEDPIPVYSENEKKALYDTYQKFSEFVKENGAKPYMVISPNKMKLYGEYNTRFLNKKDGMEDIYDYFRKRGGFNFIYPLKEMVEAKKTDYVFYKTDHHWTHFGAFIGYDLLMNEIKKDFPMLKKMTLDDYDISNVKFTHNSVWEKNLNEGCSYNRLSLRGKKFFDVAYKEFSTNRFNFTSNSVDGIGYLQVDNSTAPKKKILITGNSFSDTAPLIWAGTASSVRWISANQFGAIRKDWLKKAFDAYHPDILVVIVNANGRNIFGGF